MPAPQEKMDLHRAFWRGEAPRPLVGFFMPGAPQTGCP